ncbi:hypothetical protein C9383_08100 [Pseudomonas palleroniana]|uniref:ATP-binding protein n=1 Tax=Pseudomonas palleroniana TaxID=191390 RepID=A0A1H5P889_9PSED|nr:ATP-binding protein [Pseudomonas palleroniana]PTC29132.1 hypothetical protein C9383_08100 [Pseudomonas palleroniana]SEF09784.1 hypothetical protein SAMN04490198_5411 [Pseudomonas palleroniana]
MQVKKLIAAKTSTHTFEFENQESLKWDGFFEVDTVRLVLGNNGSGKTTLLSNMAASISSATPSPRRAAYDVRETSSEKLSDAELENIGVIYFSPLPYRRRLPLRKRLVDASPRFEKKESFDRVEQFYKVASDLALNSNLRAEVCYEFELFKLVLVPALVSMSNNKGFQADEPVNLFLAEYKKLARKRESISLDYYESERLSSQLEGAIDTCVLRFERFVLSKLPRGKGRLALLATLSSLAKKESNVKRVGRLFFNLHGFVNDPFYQMDEQLFSSLRTTLKATLGFMKAGEKDDVRRHNRSYSFLIHSAKDAASIKMSEAAVEVRWTDQSSGLRALVDQFSLLRNAFANMKRKALKHILVFIDEGDAYLHLEWQRRYISLLNKFLLNVKSEFGMEIIQVVIATHSPVITGDFPACMITNLDQEVVPQNTFAAPLEDIVLNSFGAAAIGEFAATKINELNARLKQGEASALDQLLLESIGDIGIQKALYRALEGK